MFVGRVVADGEPLWLPGDTEVVLAWIDREADLCGSCGHPRSETMRPEAEGAYTAERLRCWACAERDRVTENMSKGVDPTGHRFDTNGLKIAVTRND